MLHKALCNQLQLYAGPQREIFLGVAKIDAGPPNSSEAVAEEIKKDLHVYLVSFFAQK